MKTKLIEVSPSSFINPEPMQDEAECFRNEADAVSAISDYLLPRLKGARSEASTEILALMRSGRSLGDAVLDVVESMPSSKTKQIKIWLEEASATRVYAYVSFRNLYRGSYGLVLTAGGPRDKILDEEDIGQIDRDESLAPYWEFNDALRELETRSYTSIRHIFDDKPYVEVTDKEDYDEALTQLGFSMDGEWEKPGLYDFRDQPPTYIGTVKSYEQDSMIHEAEFYIDMIYDSDWQSACRSLLTR